MAQHQYSLTVGNIGQTWSGTNGASTCDAIRKIARDELGRGIASIWFN